MSAYEDAFWAREIINNGREYTAFNNTSMIYKSTNENINDFNYKYHLKKNDKVLSVIGSGDQILNSILYDSFNIDAFDISRFPKYFLEFKLTAVKHLCYEEYFQLFYDNKAFGKSLYKKVLEYMPEGDAKEFWSSIANVNRFKQVSGLKSPREVYNSKLFTSGAFDSETAKENNPFLCNRGYYDRLKYKIDNAKIRYLDGNIYDLELDDDYDFVNLSNICMYGDLQGLSNKCKYKDFVTNLKIREGGKVLTYFMRYTPGSICDRFYNKYFKDDDRFTIEHIKSKDGVDDAIMVYKKVR